MIKKEKLTKKQLEILIFIKKYIANNGYSPSTREICKGNNLSSPATVHNHLKSLIKKGYIKKTNSKYRSIEILDINEYVNENKGLLSTQLINDSDDLLLSLNEKSKDYILSLKLINENNISFLLKVSNQKDFNDGDILFIKDMSSYNYNDYIVLFENKKITVTKYNNQNNIIGKVIYKLSKI
ncbi:MAG: hypothetical protein IJ572_05375 [Bacilli bacterium]|nr:hypothetical protein [Bacilli bacterium]